MKFLGLSFYLAGLVLLGLNAVYLVNTILEAERIDRCEAMVRAGIETTCGEPQ